LGSTLNPINSSLIATALVPIAAAMHVPVGQVASLVAAVYLTSAVAQPAAGKLAEVFGPRRVFLVGTLCILAAGIIGGLAHSLGMLIVSRVFIGLGSSTAYPSAMVIVRRRAGAAGMSEPPGGVLGGLAIAGMAVAALGLPLGGLLVGAAGWQTTFFINIPVAVITLLAALLWLPPDEPRTAGAGILSRIDFGGIVLFAGTITSLLVFLLSLPSIHWVPLVISVVACAALVAWELTAHEPFIDLRLLARNRALTRTYLRVALTSLVMYGAMYGVSQWLEPGRHLSPEQTGLLIFPMAIVAPIVSFPVSRRNLVRGPLLLTGAALVVGSIGVALMNGQTSMIFIAVVMLVFGLGMGLFTVGNQTALYSQAPAQTIGSAAGLFRTFAYLGSIGSSAVTGIVFRSTVNVQGLHTMAWVLLAAGVIVLVMTIADRKLVTVRKAPVAATRTRKSESQNGHN
ncbi:MAG TPA: MFS transporter, partial [Spirochaetia bacterium]|nr:MFS transporter [Spirochaetia bacterium]